MLGTLNWEHQLAAGARVCGHHLVINSSSDTYRLFLMRVDTFVLSNAVGVQKDCLSIVREMCKYVCSF